MDNLKKIDDVKVVVISNEPLPDVEDHFLMKIESSFLARLANPGQFFQVRVQSGDMEDTAGPVIRTPLSLHRVEGTSIELLYKEVGPSTKLLSKRKVRESIKIFGPLGNGFDISLFSGFYKPEAFLVGGGCGVVPLYALAESLVKQGVKVTVFIGAKETKHLVCVDKFKELCLGSGSQVHVATEDGLYPGSYQGFVTSLVERSLNSTRNVIVYGCGPSPMLAALDQLTRQLSIPLQVSLESYMGCGYGACHSCAIPTAFGYKSCCTEGPVFDARDNIDWKALMESANGPAMGKPVPETSLAVKIGDIACKNNVWVASGTFDIESSQNLFDINEIGMIFPKTVTLDSRQGNKPPRLVKGSSYILNSIGLENPGARVTRDRYEQSKRLRTNLVISITGSNEELVESVKILSQGVFPFCGFEVNLSCPNVSHDSTKNGGSSEKPKYKLTAQDPEAIKSRISAVRKETNKLIFAKLTPNVTDITEMALAAVEGGADAIVATNTVRGMAIDSKTAKPLLGNVVGGMSGPAIKPIALLAVFEIYKLFQEKGINIPIIGVGGISSAEDVMEFIFAGATAVQIGTNNLANPVDYPKILSNLKELVKDQGATQVSDLVGKTHRIPRVESPVKGTSYQNGTLFHDSTGISTNDIPSGVFPRARL